MSFMAAEHFIKNIKKDIVDKIEKRLKLLFWHKDFDDPKMARIILADMPDIEDYKRKTAKIQSKYTPSSLGFVRVCYETALLTREQEFHLFRQYNFRKYRAKTRLENRRIQDALIELNCADLVRGQIAAANVRLAMPIVKKYTTSRHYEDLISESYCLVLKAVDYFDFTRGIKFSTYGTWVMIRNIQRTIKQWHEHDGRYQTGVEKFDPCKSSGQSESELKFEQHQQSELVHNLLKFCSDRERLVLEARFFQEKTLLEIAQEIGVSKERVRQIEKTALEKIAENSRQSA